MPKFSVLPYGKGDLLLLLLPLWKNISVRNYNLSISSRDTATTSKKEKSGLNKLVNSCFPLVISLKIGFPIQIPCFMLLHITQVINSHIHSHKIVTAPTTIMSEFQGSENSKDEYKNWYTHKARHYYRETSASSAQ